MGMLNFIAYYDPNKFLPNLSLSLVVINPLGGYVTFSARDGEGTIFTVAILKVGGRALHDREPKY